MQAPNLNNTECEIMSSSYESEGQSLWGFVSNHHKIYVATTGFRTNMFEFISDAKTS